MSGEKHCSGTSITVHMPGKNAQLVVAPRRGNLPKGKEASYVNIPYSNPLPGFSSLQSRKLLKSSASEEDSPVVHIRYNTPLDEHLTGEPLLPGNLGVHQSSVPPHSEPHHHKTHRPTSQSESRQTPRKLPSRQPPRNSRMTRNVRWVYFTPDSEDEWLECD